MNFLNRWISPVVRIVVAVTIVMAVSGRVKGQEPAPEPQIPLPVRDSEQSDAPRLKYVSIGFRVRGFTADVFDDGKSTPNRHDTTPNANTTQTFATTSNSGKITAGPAIEVPLPWRLSILGEFYFQRASYTKVTTTYKGIDDLSTSALKSTVTERTKASYWDIPLLVRYRPFGKFGILSKAFVEGGATVRLVRNVRTGTDTLFADQSTAYNETPVRPAAGTVTGTIFGAGFRFVDDARIKVIPELRYTNWNQRTFDLDSTRSRSPQLEFGISVLF